MSLSSNTAQTRELTELRNHLKWLDEERRKSSRKMAELEQRIAQQGRELADREQKIQELEWHVNNFSERFERLPDLDANAAGTEQRLQDLEWHLSNMNAQLQRLPNMDEERARWQQEIARLQEERTRLREETDQTIKSIEERVESRHVLLESRLLSDMSSTFGVEEQERLVAVQAEQAEAIQRMEQRYASIEESISRVAAESQAGIGSLASESQANIGMLAASLQEHIENMVAQNQTRMSALEEEWGVKLRESLASQPEDLALEFSRLDAQLADLAQAQQQLTLQVEQLGLQNELVDGRFEPITARQNELEESIEKMSFVREIMPLLDRFEQELELRQAEEVRLSNLIGTQESRFQPLANTLEGLTESNEKLLGRISDLERTQEELRPMAQDTTELKATVNELNNRIMPLSERLTTLSNSFMKAEAGIQSLTGDQAELRDITTNLTADVRRNQGDVARQMEAWQATLDENKDTIERFTQQWIMLSNQYKEARMAVQNFAHWQKQLEQQKREASEMLRLESNRMQARWDGFLQEVQDKLKNFEIDLNQKWQSFELENEQKWSAARRADQMRHEELAAVDDLIQKLQQDNRNLIWRVQAAQADAIKKWPRLLMEEIEKAVEINPNRRLSATAAPRGDMSVVDAIEQGLITIDYNDEIPNDL